MYMLVCVYVCARACEYALRVQRKGWIPWRQAVTSHLTWVLGTVPAHNC